MDASFQLNEELLSVGSLKDTTTDKDLFRAVENCMARTGLEWNRIASVTTDGARALTGKNVGLLKLMNDKIKPCPHTSSMRHLQKSLCKGDLNTKHVTDSIVNVLNLTRAKGLNHRQFRALLAHLKTVHLNVLHHSRVRWLNLGKVLRRVWELR